LLDLFPDPAKGDRSELREPSRYLTVYRRKHLSSSLPRVGLPTAVQPGDTLVFFDGQGRYATRTVAQVFLTAVLTHALISEGVELCYAVRVLYEHFDEVLRPA